MPTPAEDEELKAFEALFSTDEVFPELSGKPYVDPALDALASDAPSVDIGEIEMGKPRVDIGEIQMGGAEPDPLDALAEQPEAPAKAPASKWDPLAGMAPEAPSLAPKEAASYVMGDAPRSHAFGVADSRPDIQAALAQVSQLHAQEGGAQPTGPGRHEQAFAAANHRPSMQEIRRMWTVQSIFGNEGDNHKAVEMLTGMQKAYDEGLDRARSRDSAEGTGKRVDLPTAQMLVLAGVTPEAAVKATEGGPLMKLLMAGGMHLGGKYRGQDTGLVREDISQTGSTYRDRMGEIGKGERAEAAGDDMIEAAKLRRRGAGGGGVGNDVGAMVTYLVNTRKVPRDIALKFANGQLQESEVTPQQMDALNLSADAWRSLSGKAKERALISSESGEAGIIDSLDRSVAAKQGDPGDRMKIQTELRDRFRDVNAATKAWQGLTPQQKQVLVSVGLEAGDNWVSSLPQNMRNMVGGPQGQQAISLVMRMINNHIKRMSGAAVNASEWSRLASEIGVSGKGFDPTRSTSVLTRWLRANQIALKDSFDIAERNYPGSTDGLGTFREAGNAKP